MKERSDSNNFNSLTATLIELRTSRCPQHGRLIRITSIPRALIPIVADQPFPQPFPPQPSPFILLFLPRCSGDWASSRSPRFESSFGTWWRSFNRRGGGFIEQLERRQRESVSEGRRLRRLTDWTVGLELDKRKTGGRSFVPIVTAWTDLVNGLWPSLILLKWRAASLSDYVLLGILFWAKFWREIEEESQ